MIVRNNPKTKTLRTKTRNELIKIGGKKTKEDATQDSSKYSQTDNGSGAKNLRVILPAAIVGTAAVGVGTVGTIKCVSNLNKSKLAGSKVRGKTDPYVLVDSEDKNLEVDKLKVDKLDENTTVKDNESTSGGDITLASQQGFEDEENREESI